MVATVKVDPETSAMIRVLALICLWLAAPITPAAAQTCGRDGAPCEVESGFYFIETPETGDYGSPPALIFLHGWGGTGAGVMRTRSVVDAALARGYAVIAPQGMPRRQGDKGGAWNSRAVSSGRDDVAYLKAVAEDAAARRGVERGAILLGGMSGGGMMTWRVACDEPEAFSAYAPIAGLLWRPLPEACAGPLRMLHTHGWSDPVVPIEGRSVAGGRITQGDLFAGFDLMRAALGCPNDDPDGYAATGAYQLRRWTDCAPGAELEMALHPGGHVIPEGWAALALDWFERAAEPPGG